MGNPLNRCFPPRLMMVALVTGRNVPPCLAAASRETAFIRCSSVTLNVFIIKPNERKSLS